MTSLGEKNIQSSYFPASFKNTNVHCVAQDCDFIAKQNTNISSVDSNLPAE